MVLVISSEAPATFVAVTVLVVGDPVIVVVSSIYVIIVPEEVSIAGSIVAAGIVIDVEVVGGITVACVDGVNASAATVIGSCVVDSSVYVGIGSNVTTTVVVELEKGEEVANAIAIGTVAFEAGSETPVG